MINVRQDNSEIVNYDYDGYLLYVRKGCLSYFENFAANSHWHDDIELMYITEGELQYNVNGTIVTMNQGDGIFVNSRQFHFGFSEEKKESEFICLLFHPTVLCASALIENEFVKPILKDPTLPFILLKGSVLWQRAVLEQVEKIYACRNEVAAPLTCQICIHDMWSLVFENSVSVKQAQNRSGHLTTLKNMVSFIQNNYSDSITLADIAASGNVSKSTCLTIFKRYLNDTPMGFLINYRLKISTTMIRETERSLSEIAELVGFHSLSYFSETFKSVYHCTPTEYRSPKAKITEWEEM